MKIAYLSYCIKNNVNNKNDNNNRNSNKFFFGVFLFDFAMYDYILMYNSFSIKRSSDRKI